MAEAEPQNPDQETASENAAENVGVISILAVGRNSIGRDLRLKADDVIVGIDGAPITYDVDRFDTLLRNYKELPALLTIYRDGKLFEVFAGGPLGCSYKYADEATTTALQEANKDRVMKPKEAYNQFESLRNIRRQIRLYSTRYEPMATILPPFWLLYRRMWEPLGVVMVTYAISLFIQPALFALVYLLISIYFHKAQTSLIRSHSLYHEYYFWMIFAAPSTKEAQELLRSFDAKCNFEFSYVGPPEKLNKNGDAGTADSPA